MSHSERQRPRRADVAKYHDGAGYISTVGTNRRRGVFYRHFSAIAPDQDTVRCEGYGPVFLDRQRRGAVQGLASRAIDDAVDILERMTRCQLSRPTRHAFRSRIEIGYLACDVGAHDRVADGIECNLAALAFARCPAVHVAFEPPRHRL